MTYPQIYISLAFQLNILIDEGVILNLDFTKAKIRELEILDYLTTTYPYFDISLHTTENKEEINIFFLNSYQAIDEGKKLGVTNNGLCMLLGYCIEAIQHKPNISLF